MQNLAIWLLRKLTRARHFHRIGKDIFREEPAGIEIIWYFRLPWASKGDRMSSNIRRPTQDQHHEGQNHARSGLSGSLGMPFSNGLRVGVDHRQLTRNTFTSWDLDTQLYGAGPMKPISNPCRLREHYWQKAVCRTRGTMIYRFDIAVAVLFPVGGFTLLTT